MNFKLPHFGIAFLLLAAVSADGQNSFTNSDNGHWEGAINWSAGHAPTNGEDILIGNAGTKGIIIDSLTPPENLTINSLTVSAPTDSTNTLQLLGASTNLDIQGDLNIGSGGILFIDSSGLNFGGQSVIDGKALLNSGSIQGSTTRIGGQMSVAGGTLSVFDINVASSIGQGFLNVSGGLVTFGILNVGSESNSQGAVTVVGGGQLTSSCCMQIGGAGVGEMTVSNGTVSTDISVLSQGTLRVAGGNVSGYLSLLNTGTVWVTTAGSVAVFGIMDVAEGSLTQSNGLLRTFLAAIGGGSATITVAGGTLESFGSFSGPDEGFLIGRGTGSTGTLWVTGGHMIVTNTGIAIGDTDSTGRMIVSNGTVLVKAVTLSTNSNAHAELQIVGGTFAVLTEANGSIRVGDFAGVTGTVTVTSGQLVATNGSTLVGSLGVGKMMNSDGIVMTGDTQIGAGTNATGSLEMSGGTNLVNGDLTVAASPGSTGLVMMTDGELVVTNASLVIGANGGVGQLVQTPAVAPVLLAARFALPRPFAVIGGGGSVLRARRMRIAAGSKGTLTVDDGSAIVLEDVVVGVVSTSTGTVAVGTSLSVGTDFELRNNPRLEFHLGGYDQGINYGFIDVGGKATFAGALAVSFANGFGALATNGSSFTVLSAGSITGAFANVASGQRLATDDGAGNFLVTYSGNELVLSDFTATSIRPSAGKFTMLLQHNPGDVGPGFPQGDGYAVLTIQSSGKVRVNGALADGTKLKFSGNVTTDGVWVVSRSLYHGGGSLTGLVSFTTTEMLTGDLIWTKPSGVKGKFYPGGFTTHLLPVGSRFTPPPVGQLSFTVDFEDGNLVAPLSLPVTLNNRFKATTPVALNVKRTGNFAGKFAHPANAKAGKFSGVVLQQQDFAAGFFLGTNETGSVNLTPAP